MNCFKKDTYHKSHLKTFRGLPRATVMLTCSS